MLHMNQVGMTYSLEAKFLGVVRTAGDKNTSVVVANIAAHYNALYSHLPAGLVKGHSINPSAALKVLQMY